MKNILFSTLFLSSLTVAFGQNDDYPEFTGDNFSLEGALAIFKKSNSIEEFEKLINEENNTVNNLDLNNDGETDYIVVKDIREGTTHVLVLSTFLSENEKQDIATIGIEKTGENEAILQIEGDPELFAENTIVEPTEEKEQLKKGKGGPSNYKIISKPIFVNVWFWPSVRFLYSPNYVTWVSPYRWGFYPKWWRPWRTTRHTIFITNCSPYRVGFYRTTTRRVVVARKVYTPRRSSSALVVHNRRGTTVIHQSRNGKTTVIKKNRRNKTVKVKKVRTRR